MRLAILSGPHDPTCSGCPACNIVAAEVLLHSQRALDASARLRASSGTPTRGTLRTAAGKAAPTIATVPPTRGDVMRARLIGALRVPPESVAALSTTALAMHAAAEGIDLDRLLRPGAQPDGWTSADTRQSWLAASREASALPDGWRIGGAK